MKKNLQICMSNKCFKTTQTRERKLDTNPLLSWKLVEIAQAKPKNFIISFHKRLKIVCSLSWNHLLMRAKSFCYEQIWECADKKHFSIIRIYLPFLMSFRQRHKGHMDTSYHPHKMLKRSTLWQGTTIIETQIMQPL